MKFEYWSQSQNPHTSCSVVEIISEPVPIRSGIEFSASKFNAVWGLQQILDAQTDLLLRTHVFHTKYIEIYAHMAAYQWLPKRSLIAVSRHCIPFWIALHLYKEVICAILIDEMQTLAADNKTVHSIEMFYYAYCVNKLGVKRKYLVF